MAKFRKIPIVVDAYQNKGSHTIVIKTLEGTMQAMPGDWIITGIDVETYPCKDSIFKRTYEPSEPI